MKNYIISELQKVIALKDRPEEVERLCKQLINNVSNIKSFKEQLTFAEKEVLAALLKEIGQNNSAVISTVPFSHACGVSRVVVTNLLAKMDNSGVAKVYGMGNKGTCIEILNKPALID